MAESSSPLHRVLQANRAAFNAQFEQARRAYPKLTGEAFLAHLSGTVEPLLQQVAAHSPGATATVAQILYEISLQLVGEERLGPHARTPSVERSWRTLLPLAVPLLVAAPRETTRLLTNSICTLELHGARVEEWIERMARALPVIPDVETLKVVGQVVAWLSGMAHFREQALQRLPQLSDPLRRGLFGDDLGVPWPKLIEALAASRWCSLEAAQNASTNTAATALQIRYRIGAFRGFGGLFLDPPTVSVDQGMLFVSDSTRSFAVIADAFGVTTHGVKEHHPKRSKVEGISTGGDAALNGLRGSFPHLATPSSAVVTAETLAVTLPNSHYLFLIGAA